MKKFIKKILLFCLPISVIAYPLDIIISNNLKKENNFVAGEYNVWNDIEQKKTNQDVLIYGSSRAWVHIDPKIIFDSLNKTCYNFGIDGHNFNMQYLRHLENLKHNKKPQTIIYSLDMFTLQKRKDLYNIEQFLPYMLYNKNYLQYTTGYEGFKETDYYIPLLRYAGKYKAISIALKNMFTSTSVNSFRSNGYRAREETWNEDFEKATKQNQKYTVTLDSTSIVMFKKFITETLKDSINIILTYSPEYIDGQNFVANRKDVIDIFNNVSQQYSVPFIDFSNDSICHNKKYFYNASHLNKNGAELFTRELTKKIKDLKILY